jgi:cytochrome P450
MNELSSSIPDRIPSELVIDFDFYTPAFKDDDVQLAWKRLQDRAPRIFWTPRNGGHWVATHADDIIDMQKNHELFSYKSITIPPNALPNLPLESDPPDHTRLRALISPLFGPAVLKHVEEMAILRATSLIEGFLRDGRVEFIGGFARQLPIYIFLSLVDLPQEDAPMLLDWAEVRVRSPDADARNEVKVKLLAHLEAVIAARRRQPGGDFVSKILHGAVSERPLSDYEAQNMLSTVMFGGLDTVASMMGFVMRFLALNPEHRRKLVDEPSLIPNAINELIRRHGIINTARLVARDVDYHGVPLREGDKVIVPNGLYGLDANKFEDPLTVDFRRPNAGQHAAFGNGVHRCPGANLARMEIKVMLELWLPRIPDFRIDGDVVVASGLVTCLRSLPLAWQVAA